MNKFIELNYIKWVKYNIHKLFCDSIDFSPIMNCIQFERHCGKCKTLIGPFENPRLISGVKVLDDVHYPTVIYELFYKEMIPLKL